MKKYLLLAALACVILAASHARAQLAISNTRTLAFGKFVAGSGGAVTVNAHGARSQSGGVLLLSAGAGTSAAFTVSDSDPANATKTYIITLPDNGAVTLSSGSNSMAVNAFVSNPSGISTLTGGTQILTVGATLSVGANQPPGNYSGTFSVTVNYQ